MQESTNEGLARAGRTLADDADVREALADLAGAHAKRAGRRRLAAPAIGVGVVLALAGGGAVAAAQWAPWTYVTDADYVIARDWRDSAGTYLGSCETRVALDWIEEPAREAIADYLETTDFGAMTPDPERIAGHLWALGRSADVLERLAPGVAFEDFDISGGWDLTSEQDAYWSDARVLQEALNGRVFGEMGAFAPGSAEVEGLRARAETQCTTDPGLAG